MSSKGHCFRRKPRQPVAADLNVHSLLDENLEQWLHLNELVQCYKTYWIKDENKYAPYETVGSVSFHNQIFEGPDTDIETEMHLADARQDKIDDNTDDDVPSASGRQLSEHYDESPLPAYELVFDWETRGP